MTLFVHRPHPHIEHRKAAGAVKVRDQLPVSHRSRIVRFNAKLALLCTVGVGSMWCAYAFAILAFAGLPTALKPGNIGFLFWFSSDLLQLTLLSVIIVGQNIQASAADKRSQQTYLDAEAILHGHQQAAEHMAVQDAVIAAIADKLGLDPEQIAAQAREAAAALESA